MKKALVIFTVVTITASCAQITSPKSSKVEISSTNSTEVTDDNWTPIDDSTVIVTDTILAKIDLRFGKDELDVERETPQEENSETKQDLTIYGNLILPNIQESRDLVNKSIVIVDEDGKVSKSDVPSFIDMVFPEVQCKDSYVENPYWMSGSSKLFTPCPEIRVGIGTNKPQFQLDTRGYGHFSDGVKIGFVNPTGLVYSPLQPAYFEARAALTNVRPWMRMVGVDVLGNNHTMFMVNKEGNVYCTAVRVRIKEDIPVPDYVFKSDYQLMPLSEVKSFVQKNSHLPNIPSEAEIKEDGLSLEEMQLKLLEKVEELTLYVIQLEETNQQQQAEINALKATVNANN